MSSTFAVVDPKKTIIRVDYRAGEVPYFLE